MGYQLCHIWNAFLKIPANLKDHNNTTSVPSVQCITCIFPPPRAHGNHRVVVFIRCLWGKKRWVTNEYGEKMCLERLRAVPAFELFSISPSGGDAICY
ncbi:hypothetical protein MHYP_G00090360 [Metynnis hypsauchen]